MPRYQQGLCRCGNRQTSNGLYKGRRVFKRICHQCKQNKSRNYTKLPYCEICGFEAKIQMQLDIDHIDGDHTNEDLSNLQTLCANCHRYKTYLNKDFLKKEYKTE